MKKAWIYRSVCSVIFFWLTFIAPVQAFNRELYEAIVAVAKGDAKPHQEAMVFMKNKTINNMRLQGLLTDMEYQASQKFYTEQTDLQIQKASQESGVNFKKQPSKSTQYSPGTDTDIITDATTVEQVQKMQKSYNQQVENFLKEKGIKPQEGANWCKNNDVDFMADPHNTPPEVFEKIADINNAAYRRPGAARFEEYTRELDNWKKAGGTGEPPSKPNMSDYADYVQEMQELSGHRADSSSKLARDLLKNSQDPMSQVPGTPENARVQELEAELYKTRAQQAKYIERINQANTVAGESMGVTPSETSGIAGKGAKRGPWNTEDASVSSALNKHLTQQGINNSAEMLAELARREPARALECQKAIANLTRDMPLSQKSDLIMRLSENSPEFAKGVAEEMRPPKGTPVEAVEISTGVKRATKVLEIGGRVMMIYGVVETGRALVEAKDVSYEAGKQAGAWTGGTILGWIGAVAGGTAGGFVSGSAVPGWGNLIGAVVGGVAGGWYGWGKGTEIGDTNSSWWDKNIPNEVSDARAKARNLPDWFDERFARAQARADAAEEEALARISGNMRSTDGKEGEDKPGSWLDYFRSKKNRNNREQSLQQAEELTDSGKLYDSLLSLYDGGNKITGSWWESFFGSSDEKKKQEFEAVQNSSDVVMEERKSAFEAEQGRRQNEMMRQEIAMQNWLKSVSSAYESARAEAQWKRENSWGAWAQSVLLDTVKGVSGGFGSGFGNRIGSGIIEHEISKRYPDPQAPENKTAVTSTSGSDNQTKSSSTGSSASSDSGTKVDKTPPVSTGKTKTKPKAKPKPPATGTVRTIDGKPFQPPPDGRNTANEISPTAAKPPAPAHWYCFHCGGDLGVDGNGTCGCRRK